MSSTSEIHVDVSEIGIRRRIKSSIAVIGNPNSGKSTLFNRLTGLRQSTGNYPGVTVEKHVGSVRIGDKHVQLIDLPGIYCLGGNSTDERIAVDVILGRISDLERPSGLIFVIDATHLYQGLYLLEQLLELQVPVVVALTMSDIATINGISIDIDKLEQKLGGITICPLTATTGQGFSKLRQAIASLEQSAVPKIPQSWPELSMTADRLAGEAGTDVSRMDVIQGLLHPHSENAQKLESTLGAGNLTRQREQLFGNTPPQAEEARQRYRWVRDILAEVLEHAPLLSKFSVSLLRWINRPWPATIMFFVLLILVFQAVFSWATPLMDIIDGAATRLGNWVSTSLGDGMVSSFLSDGLISGVGSVIIFLPQILILFLFIIVLEDSGYLARAAFLMDRVMRSVGLSGQSVIPMLSSFACAIPAIMATRVIPDRRDRIATIIAAPFMTCSARLPIYALMIAAFIPAEALGWFNLQGLVLFGLYLLGIAGGLASAWLLKSSALKGPVPVFTLALPEFRTPNVRTVMIKLLDRARIFLKRAGTIIFTVAVIVWFLAYFPRLDISDYPGLVPAASSAEEVTNVVTANEFAAAQLSQSWLGRTGQFIEPVFLPLGWDWRVSSAVIAGFPAREVVVAVMGTLYAVGSEADEASLAEKLKKATWPDGQIVYTLPMVLGMLIFYAWCLQCAATVATIRRETNSWRWPVFAWCYMTGVAYIGAFLVYQIGSIL